MQAVIINEFRLYEAHISRCNGILKLTSSLYESRWKLSVQWSSGCKYCLDHWKDQPMLNIPYISTLVEASDNASIN